VGERDSGEYRPGMVVKGHVTNIANFGRVRGTRTRLEGLLHIFRISDQKIEKPEEALKVGAEKEVDVKDPPRSTAKSARSPVPQRAMWAQEEIAARRARPAQQAERLRGGWKAARTRPPWRFEAVTRAKRQNFPHDLPKIYGSVFD